MEETLVLKPGFNTYTIDTQEDLKLSIVGHGMDSSLYVLIKSAKKISLHTLFSDGNYHILYWNDCDFDVEINEVNELKENSVVKVAFGQLSMGNVIYDSKSVLERPNSTLHLKTATLNNNDKSYRIECMNSNVNTHVEMENHCINTEKGVFALEAIGNIMKGSKGATNFQTSRCLTFGDIKKANISPLLLIDENDLQASHAASVGQIDENQMYYLQSRGLTYKEATNLITIGYLTPIVDFIDDEQLKELLKTKIEDKVNALCLI